VIREQLTSPLAAVVVGIAAALLTGCATGPTPVKPTCCDQAVTGSPAVEVSGVLLTTGGVDSAPTPTPVSGGIVTFQLETGLGYSSVTVRTAQNGDFHVYLTPGAYRVEAAITTSPGALKGAYGPFQIHSGRNGPLKLTLVAL
jgi:hypothetical protein